ncbi:hypothetical protein BMETH_102_0 [methanotrophic bacterial endosymbiont of Bathymodiolus sp.]|nr:hypothetical protein BMETH_102_0 [methanotrophic bacterial endosymbiont of Bathymodiolus sp.]
MLPPIKIYLLARDERKKCMTTLDTFWQKKIIVVNYFVLA